MEISEALDSFFNSKTKTIAGGAFILTLFAVISRILGMIRDWLLARSFGTGQELDVYFAAFRIPDFVYNVLIAGGIIVAFLPLFSEYFQKDENKAWHFANNTLNVFLFLLLFFSLILFIFTPALVKLVTPGFNQAQLDEVNLLTRLMLLSPILLGLSSIFSGILQYFHRFLAYSLAPVLYNLGIILGIIFLAPRFGILGVVFGVIFGAFLHFFIQVPSAIKCGFKYRPIFNFKDEGLKRVFLLMIPRTFGVAAQQINLVIMTAIASLLATGSIVIFNLANNLHSFPVGIIGISFAIAAFPVFSKNLVEFKKEEFIRNFSSVFGQIMYLTIPISILLFMFRNQIVTILYRHGQFSFEAARLTAEALGLFALSILVQSLIPLIFRAFFAFKDTKTPTVIALLTTILTVIFSFYFVRILSSSNVFESFIKDSLSLRSIGDISILGLPLAFSFVSSIQFVLLMVFLYKKSGSLNMKFILNSFFKIFISAVLMIIFISAVLYLIRDNFDSQTFSGAFLQLLAGSLIGALTYIIFTFIFRSPETKMFRIKI